ncbi:MAG TPA: FAD:protein FMN transferase [Bacillota bacterium]|nr:FAD:protein FMN transferase [Bacillota bacterium]
MHTFRAMNTDVRTYGFSTQMNEKVESWFRFVEEKLSRFKINSELSRLNRSQGTPFLSSALLFEVLDHAHSYHSKTGGLFNPYLGHVLCDLGYNQSFETLSEIYSVEKRKYDGSIQEPLKMDPVLRSIMLSPHVSVDLGGFAKGWIAHYLSQLLKEEGVTEGVIDAGGDIVFWGNEENVWEIEIEDPFESDKEMATLKICREAGVATSSIIKRSWKDASGNQYNHIVDPRTQQPSQSDFVQVTVLAPNLIQAEVYAKCVLILGSEKGISWLEKIEPELAVIGVRYDHSIVIGSGLESYCLQGGMDFGRAS